MTHDQPTIYLIGHPGDVGGARTEIWHTLRLWRRFGLAVTAIPTWTAEPAWRDRLAAAGVPTLEIPPPRSAADLAAAAGLAGSIVVSFCNQHFIDAASYFRDAGCRIVWVNCMTWTSPRERAHLRCRGPFDRYVFQSRHQAQTILARNSKIPPARCRLIRGAFIAEDFSFRPRGHIAGEPFIVGRISRAAPDKFPRNAWDLLAKIPHPIRARLMAWDARVEAKLGRPPAWAQCLPPGAESSAEFLGSLHGMLQLSGGADENWPRSGLEAMAAGVPIVAPDRWGWREMIEHGQTGFLAQNDAQAAYYTARMAYDEELRLNIAHRARRRLVEGLAPPGRIWEAWRRLFEGLAP